MRSARPAERACPAREDAARGTGARPSCRSRKPFRIVVPFALTERVRATSDVGVLRVVQLAPQARFEAVPRRSVGNVPPARLNARAHPRRLPSSAIAAPSYRPTSVASRDAVRLSRKYWPTGQRPRERPACASIVFAALPSFAREIRRLPAVPASASRKALARRSRPAASVNEVFERDTLPLSRKLPFASCSTTRRLAELRLGQVTRDFTQPLMDVRGPVLLAKR